MLRVDPRELWKLALLGCVGIAMTNFTYYYTIRETSVATAILIQYVAPILVVGYAVISREERVTTVKIAAALLTLLGCFLAVGGYDSALLRLTGTGLLTGVLSILGFAFLTVFTRRVRRMHDVWTLTLYAHGFASLFWLIVHPPWVIAGNPPSAETWGSLYILAIVSLLLPNLLYFAALRVIESSRAIISGTLEPVVAIGSAAVFLGEGLTALQLAGAGIVLSSIIVLQLHPEVPERAKHTTP
jgi:drug/metabolite transporter (DMT)-like permease